MKHGALKLLLLLLFFGSGGLHAQNLSGIWRGYFISDGFDQYKFEIQIKQTPQRTITGVSYSYLTTIFYGKATLTGTYNPKTKRFVLQEIKTVELRMSQSSVACIMKCLLDYSRSGPEEFLEGAYTSKYEKTSTEDGTTKGEGCGGGKVFLRKVPTSDFYVEPFLRDNPAVKKPNLATTKPRPATPAKPAPKKPAATPPVAKKPVPQPAKPAATPRRDSVVRQAPVAKQEQPKINTAPAPRFTPPSATRNRTNDLVQTLSIREKEITVKLYDNGEIDDDTISVYLDSKLVLAQKRLTAAPLTLTLKLNAESPDHVLVLVAENLGRIPPNTSLMIVQDGDRRYQVRITSTEQRNAMVRFRYEGSD